MSFVQQAFRGSLRLASLISRTQEFRLTKPFLKGKILDIGCARGDLAEFVSPDNYAGIDIIEPKLKIARERYPGHRFSLADCTNKNQLMSIFKPKQFDVILLLTLLDFIQDPKLLVNNLADFLKDDGRIIVTVPSPAIGRTNRLIYRKARAALTETYLYSRRSLVELFDVPFSIETFKHYNLGLSYFVVARLNGRPSSDGSDKGRRVCQ